MQRTSLILLLLKYLINFLVILLWSFILMLFFDNILGFIVNKAVQSLNYYDLNGVLELSTTTGLELDF